MVSRYALNEIAAELDRIQYCGNDLSSYGCSMRSMHGQVFIFIDSYAICFYGHRLLTLVPRG